MSDRCANCPNRGKKIIAPEPARSIHGAKLSLISDSPSRADLESRRPFMGGSGNALGRALQAIGLKRGHCHLTSATLCDSGRDPKEIAAAAKICRPRLLAEIIAAAAPVIVPMGSIALANALGTNKKLQISKWRGSVSEVKFGAAVPAVVQSSNQAGDPALLDAGTAALVAPTIGLDFVRRSPHWQPILEIDFSRLARLLNEGFTPPELQPGRRIIIAKDLDCLAESLDLLASDAVSFDVETVGLGPVETPLVCFGLSDGNLTIVVPWSRGRDGREPWWHGPTAAELVSSALNSRIMVTHNGPAFDHIVAARYGVRFDQWDDTLLMSHAIRSHLPKNLGHVVTTYCDVGPWKQLEDRTATLERLWTYNARDCLYTAMAYRAMKPELELEAA